MQKKYHEKVFGSTVAIDHSTYEHKAEAVIYVQNRSAVINSLVVCDWIFPIIQSQVSENRIGDMSLESQLLEAVTGYHVSEKELDHIGERVWNLSRLFMVREGRSREDDTLHASYFTDRNGEKAIRKGDFENAKTKYYELRGWDVKTGWPNMEKISELQLTDVAEVLRDTIERQ